MTWLKQSLQDIRYAFRLLSRTRRFTATVVLTLALGIGVNTAAFSVVNAVLLRPLTYPDADRLIWIADRDGWSQQDTMGSRADFEIWRTQANSFERMTAYGSRDLAVFADGEATQERITSVAGDFWEITGARPEAGRLFQEGDTNRVVLSHQFSVRRFAGEPNLIGKTVLVNGHTFFVSGVLPESFRLDFPQLLSTSAERRQPDAYIPIPPGSEQPREPITEQRGPAPYWVNVIGKLKPGATIEQARAEMETIHARLSQQFPSPTRGELLTVAPLAEKIVGEAQNALIILLAAAGFVLLIAAANVGNLFLAQLSKRRQEFAVRRAVGAGSGRLARQTLIESLVLALLGGATGIAIASWTLGLVTRLGAGSVPRLAGTEIDAHVLAFTLLLSLLTAIGFSTVSRLATGSRGTDELRSGARFASDTAGTRRLHSVLVVGELALAFVLLSGAGLMLKSFWRMNERPPGFAPHNILSMHIPLSGPRYQSWMAKESYIRELIGKLQGTPGVQAAGVDAGTVNTSVEVDAGQPNSRPAPSVVAVRMVSPGYLQAIGTPLLQGSWPQNDEELDVVMVNEAFAQDLGGNRDVVGKRIQGSFLTGTIIGVVADFKHSRLDAAARPEVYCPYQMAPSVGSIRLLARATGAPALASSIHELARSIDRTQPIYRLATLEELLADSIAPRIFHLALLGAFSGTAFLMALVGIYGVVAYSVEQRTREIGIRIALGAQRREVIGMIVRQGVRLALLGTALGLAGTLALGRAMDTLLYGVEANDAATLLFVALGLFVTALLACWRPAMRASGVHPVTTLRHG